MLVKVISTKTVFGDKERVLETAMSDKGKEHFLYRVFGVIQGMQIGKGRFKRVNAETNTAEDTTWTKFFGDFCAINVSNENFEGASCFLPSYVNGQFESTLSADTEGGASIEFAYDVFVRYNKDSATSYEYIAQPVRRAGDENPLAKMVTELAPLPNARALAAPVADKAKTK